MFCFGDHHLSNGFRRIDQYELAALKWYADHPSFPALARETFDKVATKRRKQMKPLDFIALGVRSEWNQEWPSSIAGQHPMVPMQMLSHISVFGSSRSMNGCASMDCVHDCVNSLSKWTTKWITILSLALNPVMPGECYKMISIFHELLQL
jgi:hypothetical protein